MSSYKCLLFNLNVFIIICGFKGDLELGHSWLTNVSSNDSNFRRKWENKLFCKITYWQYGWYEESIWVCGFYRDSGRWTNKKDKHSGGTTGEIMDRTSLLRLHGKDSWQQCFSKRNSSTQGIIIVREDSRYSKANIKPNHILHSNRDKTISLSLNCMLVKSQSLTTRTANNLLNKLFVDYKKTLAA